MSGCQDGGSGECGVTALGYRDFFWSDEMFWN